MDAMRSTKAAALHLVVQKIVLRQIGRDGCKEPGRTEPEPSGHRQENEDATMKMFLGFVRLLPLAFAFACSGADQAQDLTGETRQALMAGDQAVICLPGSWTTDDGPACEDRSGVRVFEIGECHIKVARKCNLAPEDGGFECKCKIKVLEATDRCDDIVWADLGVSKC